MTHEYDRTAWRAPVIVLEVRNAELMESITKQVAERGITYGAIVALIGAIDSFTVSTTPAVVSRPGGVSSTSPTIPIGLHRTILRSPA
jgi:hypothetical protein